MDRISLKAGSLAVLLSALLAFSGIPCAFAEDTQTGSADEKAVVAQGSGEADRIESDSTVALESDSAAAIENEGGRQDFPLAGESGVSESGQIGLDDSGGVSAASSETADNSGILAEGSGENGVGASNPADISWTLTVDGVLTFTGTGAVKEFGTTPTKYPWYQSIMDNFRDTGIQIVLGEGITGVPKGFISYGPDKLATINKLVVPSTLTSLGSSSFTQSKIVEIEGTSPVCDGSFLYSDTSKTTIYKAETSLKEAVIPEGVTQVGAPAFFWADLDSFYIPASLTDLSNSLSGSDTTKGGVARSAEIAPGNTSFTIDNDVASANFRSVLKANGGVAVKVAFATYTDARGVVYTADKVQLVSAPADLAGSYLVEQGCLGIASGAFKDCTQLTSVVLPGGLQKIGGGSFDGCVSLTSVFIPQGVTDIGSSAFRGCSSLASIELPDSVTSLGQSVFLGTAILSFAVPSDLWIDKELASFSKDSATTWGTGALFTTTAAAGLGRSDIAGEQIWGSITQLDLSKYGRDYLAPYMFMGLNQLTEVTIPANVRILETGAFFGCTSLEDVYCYNPSVSVAGAGTTGDPGLGWTADTYPTFSHWTTENDGLTWKVKSMEGLNLYGLAYASNALIEYAQTNNCNFIPFVIFDNADSESLFGYKVTGYNNVSVADMAWTGSALAPEVRVSFTDRDGVADRVLDSSSCSIAYKDASGNIVSSIVAPGAYTAQIIGDGKSVFGTQNVSFEVTAPAAQDVAVSGNVPNASMSGSLWGDNVAGADEVAATINRVTSGADFDALVSAVGNAQLAGVFEVGLTADGATVHDNFGTLTVTIPVDPSYNGRTAVVYHRHQDGSITSQRIVVQNGQVSFTVSDLSTFAIGIENVATTQASQQTLATNTSQEQQGGALAQTRDAISVLPGTIAMASSLGVLALAAFMLRRRQMR